MSSPKYSRVLLKLSGEALMGRQSFGIDPEVPRFLVDEITPVLNAGVQVGIVIGGGNIFRGVSQAAAGMERAQGDNMGMLSTVINSLSLQDSFERSGIFCRVMSALEIRQVAEPYLRRRAIRHLEKGRVVIFAGGTGNPYFTTDTAAALRACEIGADILIKATNVDGVYDSDPKKNPNAQRYDTITYTDVLTKDLKVMDAAAISLCRDNNLPILVFDIHKPGGFLKAINGEHLGTLVCADKDVIA